MIEYKKYTVGPIDFDPEDGTFSGTAAGLRDVIHFEGSTVRELKKAFQESVDTNLKIREEGQIERAR